MNDFIRLTSMLVFALSPTFAQAGGYGSFRTYSYRSYAQPLVQTYYFVGQPIRTEAIVEAEKRADPNYQLWMQFQALLANNPNIVEQLAQAAQQPQAMPLQAAPDLQTVVSCSRCHSGAEPKGGLTLDGKSPISAASMKAIKTKLAEGSMPPKDSPEAKDFGPEYAGTIVVESIDLLQTE